MTLNLVRLRRQVWDSMWNARLSVSYYQSSSTSLKTLEVVAGIVLVILTLVAAALVGAFPESWFVVAGSSLIPFLAGVSGLFVFRDWGKDAASMHRSWSELFDSIADLWGDIESDTVDFQTASVRFARFRERESSLNAQECFKPNRRRLAGAEADVRSEISKSVKFRSRHDQ